MRFNEVCDKFLLDDSDALIYNGVEASKDCLRRKSDKENFGFHRWQYSEDLKTRTCILCGKTEDTPERGV